MIINGPVVYGPNAVTNGLVLYIDSANTRSYIGTGSNWIDISGNNNVTLSNNPSFTVANKGIITMNGTNQHGTFSTSILPYGSSPSTISGWVRTSSTASNGYKFFISYGNPITYQSRYIGINGASLYTGSYGADISYMGAQANVWLNLTSVYDGVTLSMYINGTVVTYSTSITFSTTIGGAYIGRQTNGTSYWDGDVAVVAIYNRALNNTEVLQNYTAMKSRFSSYTNVATTTTSTTTTTTTVAASTTTTTTTVAASTTTTTTTTSSLLTTYYISATGGSDITGTGSNTNPWATLYKATSTVTASNSLIYVKAGTYTETQQSTLAENVSIVGTGTSSVIKSTLSSQYVPIIAMRSLSEGTNGNQYVSNLKFDGGMTTSWGIDVKGRSNVSINNCTFIDFYETGVNWAGRLDGNQAPPGIYATGNSFYSNIMNNCATADIVFGRGCFQFGGQDGMLIYNNNITNNSRTSGRNGWPIKGTNDSYIKNCKIYNNILTSSPFPYSANGENGYWDFAIELFFNLGGTEIYGNTISGSIDMNWQLKGSSTYSVWIHNNEIGFNTLQPNRQSGIILEFDTQTAIIENNRIKNVSDGIVFSMRSNSLVSNTIIRNNLIYDLGQPIGGYGRGIGHFGSSYSIDTLEIYNNTLIGLATASMAPYIGIAFGDVIGGTISKWYVRNNIIKGFMAAGLDSNATSSIVRSAFEYNDFYLNTYDVPFTTYLGTSVLPIGNTLSNNFIGTNPLLTSSPTFSLQSGSPMIDAGVYIVGITYSGSAPDIGYVESQTVVTTSTTTTTTTFVTYYISATGGSDSTGTGTITNPWATLYKATTSVTSSNSLIYVKPGTYTETNTCNLSTGVSITGAGTSSIIKSTVTADFVPMIRCSSPIGSNGNQSISFIKIDGTLTAKWGILVEGRSNFSIHDITMVDVFSVGIIIDGGINAGEASTYAVGNTFYNNIINNCAEYAGGYARGCVCIGSQDGMLFYNNQITQDQRAIGFNGEPIKYWNGGFTKNIQIYNNTLKKKALAASAGVNDWDFNIELFMSSGLNVYENTFINGCIDLPGLFKGTYSYSAWIHNNNFYSEVPNAFRQSAITIEVLIQDVIIEDNIINNFSTGVLMTPRIFDVGIPVPGADTKNITIRRNLMTTVVGESGGHFVDFGGGDFQQFQDCYVYNNTCLYQPGLGAYVGIGLPQATSGFIKNLYFKNNIFSNSTYAVFYQEPTSTVVMDNLQITNNSFYGSTTNDFLFLGTGATGTNYVINNNTHNDPVYASGSYLLSATSSLIDAGVYVGLTYTGSAPDIGYAEYLPPFQNLLLFSESINNVIWDATNSNVLVTQNQDYDLSGSLTMNLCSSSFSPNNLHQDITVTPGQGYYVSWDVKRGSGVTFSYNVFDLTHFSDIIAPTNYYSSTSTSVQRVQYGFTAPSGCNTIRFFPIRDLNAGGTVYIGRLQLSKSSNARYITTTSSIVP